MTDQDECITPDMIDQHLESIDADQPRPVTPRRRALGCLLGWLLAQILPDDEQAKG